MEQHDTKPLLTLLPATKAQRMNRIKDAWEKIGQAETANAVEVDVKRATLLAEELEEEAREGPITQQEIAEATGISQSRIDQLLRYYRFLQFCESLTTIVVKLSEGRFRAYYQAIKDPSEPRTRDPKKRHAQERRTFLVIVEYLEGGKPPPRMEKAPQPPTVAQMHATKHPVRALRKEVKRLYTAECKPIIASLKDFLGRDRAAFSPGLMANAAMKLEQWEKKLETLLDEFSTESADE